MKKKRENTQDKSQEVTRKQTVHKIVNYANLTALGTFLILNPQKAQAASPGAPGGGF
jgi:hypothetical protein